MALVRAPHRQGDPPLSFKDALAHLTARAAVMKHEKTNWNRLRWTRRDIAAVEAIVAGVAKAVDRTERKQAREQRAA